MTLILEAPDRESKPLDPVTVTVYVPGGVVGKVSKTKSIRVEVPGNKNTVLSDRRKTVGPVFLAGDAESDKLIDPKKPARL